jgi:hypothetical protein
MQREPWPVVIDHGMQAAQGPARASALLRLHQQSVRDFKHPQAGRHEGFACGDFFEKYCSGCAGFRGYGPYLRAAVGRLQGFETWPERVVVQFELGARRMANRQELPAS